MRIRFQAAIPCLLILFTAAVQASVTSGNRVTGVSLITAYADTIVGPQEFRGFGESMEVAEGEIVEVLSQKFGFENSYQEYVSVSLELRGRRPDGVEFPLLPGDIIAGPATITTAYLVRSNVNQGVEAQIEFNAFTSLAVSNPGSLPYVSSNAVVIPENASGPVEVFLESSTDLVTWTRAEPGLYGADTQQRFFRLRAVTRD